MMLDLDGFKAVNDKHGHEAGDKVLKAVGSALLGAVRASDTVARFGGDEFGVALHDAPGDDALATLMDRMVATVSAPIALAGGAEVRVGASIGVGLYPAHGETPEVLLDRADRAMYAVKSAGKNGWKYYDGEPPANETADASPALAHAG
jgi:diguanylate cyclase (GGDEF)-like protein